MILFAAQEMLRLIPVALASCTRFFEAMSATRESFATLQKLRLGHFDSQRVPGVSYCLTPPPWKTEANYNDLGITNQRRKHLDQVEDVNSQVTQIHHNICTYKKKVVRHHLTTCIKIK